jgi:predicted metal-binding membrane protein
VSENASVNNADAAALAVQRNIILSLLLVLAALAWVLLLWQLPNADHDMAMASPTMGLRAPLFLTIWVVMMAAMMFPAAAPMILTFHTVQAGKRMRGQAFVSTWVFVAAYLVVWTLAGLAAYSGAFLTEALAEYFSLSAITAGRIGGALFIVAGLYQFSRLKDICLAKCRTPITFIMTSWRDGHVGALRMGLAHGVYCLGCCWLLFAILFPLGIMNIAAMAIVTLIVFAEKALPWGQLASRAVALSLIAYGLAVIAVPEMLPIFPTGDGMDMPMKMPMPESATPPDASSR